MEAVSTVCLFVLCFYKKNHFNCGVYLLTHEGLL